MVKVKNANTGTTTQLALFSLPAVSKKNLPVFMFSQKKLKKQVLQVLNRERREQKRRESPKNAHLAETTTFWGVLRIRAYSHTHTTNASALALFFSLRHLTLTPCLSGDKLCMYICTMRVCVRGNVVRNSKNFAQATNETGRGPHIHICIFQNQTKVLIVQKENWLCVGMREAPTAECEIYHTNTNTVKAEKTQKMGKFEDTACRR